MKKQIKIWILVMIMLTSLVYAAGNQVRFNFKDPINPITNVDVIGYNCTDAACTTLGTIFQPYANSLTSDYAIITFPETPTVVNYGLYFGQQCYAPTEQQYTNSGGNWPLQNYQINFTKLQNCAAPIATFDLYNSGYRDRPVLIAVNTTLDATTASAFSSAGPLTAIPPAFNDHYSALTNITIEIINSTGQVVETNSTQVEIYADTIHQTNYIFKPQTLGLYTVKLKTNVIDCQCENSTEQEAQELFNVYLNLIDDLCHTNLYNLNISPNPAQTGQQILIDFDRLSIWQHDSGARDQTPTNFTLTIKNSTGNIIYTNNSQAPATAISTVEESWNFTWTPTIADNYLINITGIANHANCSLINNSPEYLTNTLTVQGTPITGPIVISNVNEYGITNENAVINWTTNRNSNSSITYWEGASASITTGQNDSVVLHSVNLINLLNNTLYYYTITSCDETNCTTTQVNNFTTQQNTIINVNWNQTTLDLGTTTQGTNITQGVLINATGNNTNIAVICNSGNCSQLTHDWTTTDLNDTTALINFICDAENAGNYNAIYNVTSTEDTTANQITINCTVNSIGTTNIEWNQTTLDLGSGFQGTDRTRQANITATNTNTNIIVNCASGNCTEIKDNWTDGNGLTDTSSAITFTCNGTNIGNYSAIFNVNSTEDQTTNQITINCNITTAPLIYVQWNQSTLNLGSTERMSISIENTAKIEAIGNNTNLSLYCLTPGACPQLQNNWTNGTDLNNTHQEINFHATPITIGNWSAIYNMTSNEYPQGTILNVTWEITPNTDTTPPIVTLINPINGIINTDGNITITYNVTDNIHVNACYIKSNTTGTWTVDSIFMATNGSTNTHDYVNLSEGTYIWNVECDDSAGNIGYDTNRTFTVNKTIIDTTTPIVTLINPLNGYVDIDGNVSVTFNVTDDIAPTLDCKVYSNTTGTWKNDVTISGLTNGNSYTWNFINLSNGLYEWNVECDDGTNTAFATNNRTFTVNNITTTTSGNIIINEIMYRPGTNEWIEIYNTELFNINISDWRFFEGGTNHGLTLLNGSDVLAPGGYAVIADDIPNFFANYPSFSGTLFDASWSTLSDTGECLALRNSTTGPILDEVCYSNAWGGASNYSLELINTSFDNNISTSWGTTYVNGGTPGQLNSLAIPDTVAPVVNLITPASGILDNTGNITIQYNITDDRATSLTCKVFSDTTGTWTNDTTQIVLNGTMSVYNYIGLLDGTYTWGVECSDGTNLALTGNRTFTVDQTAPTIIVNSPTAMTYITNNVSLNITATDANLDTVWYEFLGVNTTYTGAIPLTLADGAYTLTVYANDTAGNLNTTNVMFNVKTTGDVNGNVNDGTNPINTATVDIDTTTYTNTTDVLGDYNIFNVTSGIYSLTATATGYLTQQRTGQVINANQITTINFVLSQTGTINGTVSDFFLLTPVIGAIVDIRQGAVSYGTDTTDINGDYNVGALAPGWYDIYVSHASYTDISKPNNQVITGQTITQDFFMW